MLHPFCQNIDKKFKHPDLSHSQHMTQILASQNKWQSIKFLSPFLSESPSKIRGNSVRLFIYKYLICQFHFEVLSLFCDQMQTHERIQCYSHKNLWILNEKQKTILSEICSIQSFCINFLLQSSANCNLSVCSDLWHWFVFFSGYIFFCVALDVPQKECISVLCYVLTVQKAKEPEQEHSADYLLFKYLDKRKWAKLTYLDNSINLEMFNEETANSKSHGWKVDAGQWIL